MDVWVLYRDQGCYSDWERDLVGVYATRAAAAAGAAAWHARYPTRPAWDGWADDLEADAIAQARAVGLGPWEAEAVRASAAEGAAPAPAERWVARPAGPPSLSADPIEFYVERWPVERAGGA